MSKHQKQILLVCYDLEMFDDYPCIWEWRIKVTTYYFCLQYILFLLAK